MRITKESLNGTKGYILNLKMAERCILGLSVVENDSLRVNCGNVSIGLCAPD